MPWGDERFSTADIDTDYRYTGQRFEDDLGIYYYNARWYDPSIGRFLQADTIVPGTPALTMGIFDQATASAFSANDQVSGNPITYDRYAYSINNPLKYIDPSGHYIELFENPLANVNIPVNDGWDLVVGAVRFFLCGLAPVHYKSYGLGMGAIVGDEYIVPNVPMVADVITPLVPYEVGLARELYDKSIPYDEIDIHHAPQSHPAAQIIQGYDVMDAPAIALPGEEHQMVNSVNIRGSYNGTPRDLMSKTMWDLRKYIDAPKSALRELLDLFYFTYPGE